MNNLKKFLMVAGIGLYVLSPADFMPGPVDDFIITLLGMAAQKNLLRTKK